MGIRLEGDVKSFKQQLEKISSIDKRKLNTNLAQVVRTSTLERFKTGKDPDGVKWTESTRVKEIGGKTLVDTGGLKKALQTKADSSGFAFGTNLKYAATHQFGDKDRLIRAKNARGLHFRVGGNWITVKAVKVTIPARPYLGISDEDISEIGATIEDFLTED